MCRPVTCKTCGNTTCRLRQHVAQVKAAVPAGHIDVATLRERLEAPRILDVRTPAEFETAHIPGSYNVPLPTCCASTVPSSPPPDRESRRSSLLLVCRSGARAGQAEQALGEAGMPPACVSSPAGSSAGRLPAPRSPAGGRPGTSNARCGSPPAPSSPPASSAAPSPPASSGSPQRSAPASPAQPSPTPAPWARRCRRCLEPGQRHDRHRHRHQVPAGHRGVAVPVRARARPNHSGRPDASVRVDLARLRSHTTHPAPHQGPRPARLPRHLRHAQPTNPGDVDRAHDGKPRRTATSRAAGDRQRSSAENPLRLQGLYSSSYRLRTAVPPWPLGPGESTSVSRSPHRTT